jgi:pimeloyl-ACP methyl ester carboxylesterase
MPSESPGGARPSPAPPWARLPPSPALPPTPRAGAADVNGIRLFHAEYGAGQAVILLHGGLANAAYWGRQIPAVARTYRVVAIDSRGQGRSTRDARPFSYALMADDVLALMDRLDLSSATLVGWSDGAIIGLHLAIVCPARVSALFAFAANADPSGLLPASGNPVLAAYAARAGREYATLSPTPAAFPALRAALAPMWASQPRFTASQLGGIRAPTWIVGAKHDEVVRPAHTAWLAATIPGARAVILPAVSHFALLQDPDSFTATLLRFLAAP